MHQRTCHIVQRNAGCRAYDNVQAAGNVAGLSGAKPGSCVLLVSNVTNIALVFGFAIFVLVYATAAYTGRHRSPTHPHINIILHMGKTFLCMSTSCMLHICSWRLTLKKGWVPVSTCKH